jgi:Cu/Zn superoxide dismutase
VALDVQGLLTQPGTEHVAHIHEGGTCADDRAGNGAPVLYPLDPLIAQEDGTASSATSLDGVTLEQLTSGAPKYVNVHAEPTGEGVPSGIACADIPGSGGETTTGGGATTAGY